MIPVQFGSRSRPLLGVYDAAHDPRRRIGVLILNPGGWELLRAYRTLRTLADRLAAAGFDVLRFDYTGTGDSSGGPEDASVEQWTTDVQDAAEELRSVAGVTRVRMVGLRIGSRIGLEALALEPRLADRVVLWDPAALEPPVDEDTPSLATPPDVLRGLRANSLPRGVAGLVILSDSQVAPGDLELKSVGPSGLRVTDCAPCWIEAGDTGAGAVPMGSVDGIVEWLAS